MDTGSSGIAVAGSVNASPGPDGWACQPLASAVIPPGDNASITVTPIGVGSQMFTDVSIAGFQYDPSTGSIFVDVTLNELLPPGSKLAGFMSWGLKLHVCSPAGDCCFDWSFGASPSNGNCQPHGPF
jgi:hypothetical protein